MCCCCGEGGDHGGWRGGRGGHGHWHGPGHGHGHEHGHGYGHEHGQYHDHHEHGRPERCDEPQVPPERERSGECGGGAEGEGFNWNESFPFGFRRHFHAPGEEVTILQSYLDGLEKEAAAVRAIIASMQAPPATSAPAPSGPPPTECCGGEPAAPDAKPAP